jgi:hypothetical protein
MLLERVAPAVFAPSFSYGWPSRLCAYLTDKKSNNDVDAALEYNLYTEAIERVRPRTPEQAVKTLSKVYSLLESDVCRATKLSALIQNAEAHNRNGVSDYMLGAAVSSAFCTFLVGWPTLLATVAITGSGLLSGAMTVLISFATFIRFFQLKTQGVARLLGVASSSVPLSTRSWLDSSPPPEITSPTPSTTTAILAPLTEAKSWLPPSTHASLDELVQVLELACRNQTDPAVTAAVRTSLALSFEIAFKVKGCGVTLPESTQALLIRAFTETKAAITKLTQLAAKHDAKEVVGVELAAAAGGMDSEMKRPRPPLPSFSSDAIS